MVSQELAMVEAILLDGMSHALFADKPHTLYCVASSLPSFLPKKKSCFNLWKDLRNPE